MLLLVFLRIFCLAVQIFAWYFASVVGCWFWCLFWCWCWCVCVCVDFDVCVSVGVGVVKYLLF